MIRMTLSEYLRVPKDYRGVWTNERWDIPNWADIREEHLGKRTLMTNLNGGTCLVVEGMGLEIIDDTDWKKPDAVRKEMLFPKLCMVNRAPFGIFYVILYKN